MNCNLSADALCEESYTSIRARKADLFSGVKEWRVVASCMYIKLLCMSHEFGARPLSIVQAKRGRERKSRSLKAGCTFPRQDNACTVFLILKVHWNLALICFLPSTFDYSHRILHAARVPRYFAQVHYMYTAISSTVSERLPRVSLTLTSGAGAGASPRFITV